MLHKRQGHGYPEGGIDKKDVETELLDYCRERLDYFQVPAVITVVDSLPMTSMGKVDRLAVEAEVERLVQEQLDYFSSRGN